MASNAALIEDKTIVITGGAGTVGRSLIQKVLLQNPREVRVIDNNESELFFLQEQFSTFGASLGDSIQFQTFIGDIRDESGLIDKMKGADVVFHTAALKHVILCEKSPYDAVQTNVMGLQNIIKAALRNNVERVIFTSSDKAVNPTNVMGTSKLMGERLVTAANSLKVNERTIFSSVRFGNVVGSRGSVVPVFYNQIRNGGPLTLTSQEMSRFIMTISQSSDFVLRAAERARGGEVFVTKMPVILIRDLATVMINLLAPRFGYRPSSIEVVESGAKAGEKFYEELMSSEEIMRSIELDDMFAILPAFRSVYEDIEYTYENQTKTSLTSPYISSTQTPMTPQELTEFLVSNNVLPEYEEGFL